MEYYSDKVHEVAQIIADETEHYTQFHRGLDSVSATKIREAAKKVVEYMKQEKEMAPCKFKVGDTVRPVKNRDAWGGNVSDCIYMEDFKITKIRTPQEHFDDNNKEDYDFDYVVLGSSYHWFRDDDLELVEKVKEEIQKDSDTTYLFFKESGKWKYEGRGFFPNTWDVCRETIMEANGGQMPGISSRGDDYVIVVIPDDDCEAQYCYPRMIKPTR